MNAPIPPQIRMSNAKKELGFGMPPSFFNQDTAMALAKIMAAPASRGIVVESAQWNVVIPILDAFMGTFGKVIAPFNTPNGQPPNGVAASSNTLQAPQMPSSDMVLLGVRTRLLVEPESRLIRGNAFNPTGIVTAPGSPDVYSQNDEVNGSLGFSAAGEGPTAATQGYIPAELLWGTPTWRAAYQLMKAYDLDWRMNNQDSLVREPLTEVGSVEPFAEAMAAGTSFTSNIDRIADTNARYASLALVPPVFFEPITHKRLGSYNAGGATNLGDFTPTREEDGSPTVYGGIGVPEDDAQSSPYIFPVPIFWPSGQPFGLQLTLNDAGALAQAQMQRWLSVTGGSNGNLGLDLNLPPGVLGGFTQTGSGIMDEITLDPVGGAGVPQAVSQGVQLNRLLAKGGTLVIQQGILGLRIPQGWKAAVYAAIQSGAIQAPMGYGTLVGA